MAWSQPHGPRACSGFVSPGLGRAHCFGCVLSTPWVGGASAVPWGIGPPRRSFQYISLASRPVVSFLLFSLGGFTSPGAGMETARLALGRLRGPPRWHGQGGLEVQKLPGASRRPLKAWIHVIPMGPVPLFQDLPRTIRGKLQRSQKGPRSTV